MFTAEFIAERFPQIARWRELSDEERAAASHEVRDGFTSQAGELRRRRQAHIDLAIQLGARYSPARCTLDSFIARSAAQKTAIERLRAFDVCSGRGLILYGTVGTGKDHLLAAMLYRACIEGKVAAWTNGMELFGRFRDAFDSGEREASLMRRFVAPDIIGISDPTPPIGDNAPWRTETLYRLIELRYREMRATWLTINATSPDDADAKLTAPVFDRLREDAELIPCFWPSHREAKS